ncbi:protein kinase [Yersinia phage vB_YenP_AP10]|uniref:Protein kinase n=1 Tax=Yersinia phage vB_YenP_AP10 TaxID=1735591 RepID=A0A0P0LE68_9CAUD|nr:serine-threonine kinase [Yersinia phage vB_YenP_AP10]ALK86935.1 protein kinase [Yersinia phage vB_YenP_AP10]
MYETIRARLETIRNLPICELNQRQPMLVALIADIVNHETEDGQLTSQAGNRALEHQDWWNTLACTMKDAGFNRLDNGHFSAAYEHALLPGKVIKVGFKKEDSGAAYVAFCRMHQGQAGIPVVHDVQRHAGCYTVVMDKLLPIDGLSYKRAEHKELEALWEHVDTAVYSSDKNWSDHVMCCKDQDEWPAFSEYDLAVIETCRKIHKFFYGIASFDMHRGNAMMDANGRLVIIDPVSFTAEDSPISKCDAIDPDALLAEIELLAARQVIEKAKRRKAMCDRESTGRVRQRLMNKRKRERVAFHRKQDAKRAERARLNHLAFLKVQEEARIAQRHFLNFGRAIHDEIFMEHSITAMHKVFAEKVQAMHQRDMVWRLPAGLPLHIDDAMQARLMG